MREQNFTFAVTGMTCANCARNIERAVGKLDGVRVVSVNFATEMVTVNFDPARIRIHDIVEKIRSAGFDVLTAQTELALTGMTCANCAMNIERTLNKKVPGVTEATVNFASERASVKYIPSLSKIDEIVEAIEKAGFGDRKSVV